MKGTPVMAATRSTIPPGNRKKRLMARPPERRVGPPSLADARRMMNRRGVTQEYAQVQAWRKRAAHNFS